MKSGNEREEQVIDENKGLSKNEDVLIKVRGSLGSQIAHEPG